MTTQNCPCASGRAFASCCEPYLTGRAAAPTAEALMRARYSAFATGNIDFVEKTHDPELSTGFDRAAAEKWSRESKWEGLEIVTVSEGGPKDTSGIVQFAARYSSDGHDYTHEEVATFRKLNGVWYFVDGRAPHPGTFVKEGPDLGRNDPCHCGSGKKYKKCHGREA